MGRLPVFFRSARGEVMPSACFYVEFEVRAAAFRLCAGAGSPCLLRHAGEQGSSLAGFDGAGPWIRLENDVR